MAFPVVSVSHLSKKYGSHCAVDDLSFELQQGEVYGFLGQNGAGKSTTIRMLLTLVQPSAGSIHIKGKDITRYRKEALREVGAMIERPDLYPYLTAREHLRLFAGMNGIRIGKADIDACLDRVGLLERAESKVKTFSQGMKQRLGLAIALVHEPGILFLDEPTNGLDPQGIADVRHLLKHLSRDKGITILISSHLLHEVEQIADRMLIIHRGKKVREGSVKELFDAHSMQVQVQLLNGSDVMAKIEQSEWRSNLVRCDQNDLHFQLEKERIPLLVSTLSQMGAEILSVQTRYSLEEQFLQLTATL
jgi:ABC-2 type transport system ATP-binding protein